MSWSWTLVGLPRRLTGGDRYGPGRYGGVGWESRGKMDPDPEGRSPQRERLAVPSGAWEH